MRGGEWVLPVESGLFSALNFALFDIVLITLVFHLTADISGRLNDASLRGGKPLPVLLCCPPLLGGGVCGTRRPRQVAMLLARGGGLFLILVANVCIRGSTGTRVVGRSDFVRVPGPISGLSPDGFADAVLMQGACKVGRPHNVLSNGQVRGRSGSKCVRDPDLLEQMPLFDTSETKVSVSTGACVGLKRPAPAGAVTRFRAIAEFHCKHARISCFVIPRRTRRCPQATRLGNASVHICPSSCRGVFNAGEESFLCPFGQIRPGMRAKRATCSRASNLAWRLTHWMDAAFLVPWPVDLFDAMDAMYAAGVEVRDVLEKERFAQTHVLHLWLVALVLKLALVAGLAMWALILWRAGFVCVLNDEGALAELLASRLLFSKGSADILLTAKAGKGPTVYEVGRAPFAIGSNKEAHEREKEFW